MGVTIFAGSDYSFLPVMQASGIVPTGGRVYLNTTSNKPGPVPACWPCPKCLPKFRIQGIRDTDRRYAVSIRPDVRQVCSGALDAELGIFLASAPAGRSSMLALWHEAGTMNYPDLDNSLLKSAQLHIQKLCKDKNYNVKVGAIEVSGTPHLGDWAARNLDFYAMDVYDGFRRTWMDPAGACAYFAEKANERMDSGRAEIAVTETNSHLSGERRAFWFQTVWDWLKDGRYNTCFLTYWNPGGPLSGPWLPGDRVVIDVLKRICEETA